MKATGSYKPEAVEYEVIDRGRTALIRLYENVTECTEQHSDDDSPAVMGWAFDRYTLTPPHTEDLLARVLADTQAWLDFAKREERDTLATEVRAQRNALLDGTDRTQIPDADIAECCRDDFRAYRQALRDIPEQPGFPYDVAWPDEPVVEKSVR